MLFSQDQLRAHCLTVLVMAHTAVFAVQPDYLDDGAPHPDSADKIRDPIEQIFTLEDRRVTLFPQLKRPLRNAPPFWRDTSLTLKLRNYSFDRDNSGAADNEAWTFGGALDYQSGWWLDRIAIGATGYTTQKLYGPRDAGGTLLLKPVQTGFGVLGQAYLRARVNDGIEFRAYRQVLNLPYINGQDSRMVPNAHEAYLVAQTEVENLAWVVGHVTKMKPRDSDEFIHMSEAAGFAGTDDGVTMVGARYSFHEGADLGAISYQAWNFMNILYADANLLWRIHEEVPLKLSAQFTRQTSVGDELGGDFDSSTFGFRAAASYRSTVLSLAATTTDDEHGIRSPFGGRPSYLSAILADFDRAGENAWLVGLTYHLTRFGLDGVSASTKYAQGFTPDSGKSASPDQTEFDLTIDIRPDRWRLLKGFWLRARMAVLDQDGPTGRDIIDYRIILNYEIPLL